MIVAQRIRRYFGKSTERNNFDPPDVQDDEVVLWLNDDASLMYIWKNQDRDTPSWQAINGNQAWLINAWATGIHTSTMYPDPE